MAILLAIKGDRTPDPDAYVFLGRHGRVLHERAMITRTHYINPNIADHGFRSTFRDWCGDETKHERETAELALSHKIGGVEGSYRRKTALAKRRALMDEWARYCESGEVISINTAVVIRWVHGAERRIAAYETMRADLETEHLDVGRGARSRATAVSTPIDA
jgi:hypothetical protein